MVNFEHVIASWVSSHFIEPGKTRGSVERYNQFRVVDMEPVDELINES